MLFALLFNSWWFLLFCKYNCHVKPIWFTTSIWWINKQKILWRRSLLFAPSETRIDRKQSIWGGPESISSSARALAFAEFQGGRWGFSGNVAPLTPLGRKSLAPDSTLSTSSFDDKFSLKSGTPNQHRLLHRLLTFCLYRSAKFIYGSLENVRRSCDPSWNLEFSATVANTW